MTQYPQNTGFAYGMTKPKANMTQPLTPDQVAVLKQDNNEINMKIDQKDLWRAMCTHKDPTTGSSTLIQNPDGSLTCSICGETFNFYEGSEADVAAAVKTLTDMLQTSKTIYLDAPVELTKQYYQLLALLQKFPTMWRLAVKNFEMYDRVDALNPISGMYNNGFSTLNSLLTAPYAMYGQQPMYAQPQQPMYGQPVYQQPMYGQPMYQQPMYAQPQQPVMPVMDMNNPMGYNAPVPGVIPAAPAQAAPAAPVNQGEVQQQKQMSV